MNIRMVDGLPFIQVTLIFGSQKLLLNNVVLDTGSSSCVFQTDLVAQIGIVPEPDDVIRQVQGIGGIEFVFTKKVDQIKIETLQAQNFMIEVGAMNYGNFQFDGILGFDFLQQTDAIIDLANMELYGR